MPAVVSEHVCGSIPTTHMSAAARSSPGHDLVRIAAPTETFCRRTSSNEQRDAVARGTGCHARHQRTSSRSTRRGLAMRSTGYVSAFLVSCAIGCTTSDGSARQDEAAQPAIDTMRPRHVRSGQGLRERADRPRAARRSGSTRSATRRSGATRSSCTRRSQARRTVASATVSARGPRSPSGSRSTSTRCRAICATRSSTAQVNLDDPAIDARAAPGQRRGRRDRRVRSQRQADRRSGSSARCATRPSTTRSRPGIGHRLDGWANRDLDVGAIVVARARSVGGREPARRRSGDGAHRARALGPRQVRRRAVPRRQGVRPRRQARADADPAGVRARRRQPAHLDRLGRRSPTGTRSSRTSRCTARATSTIRGSTTPRSSRSPPRNGFGHVSTPTDQIGSRRSSPALQLLPARARRAGAAVGQLRRRGGGARQGAVHRQGAVRRAATSPPLYTEPGWNMHTAAEIGIDDFQASALARRALSHAARCAACSHTPRAASITTAGSRRSPTWSTHYDATFSLGLGAGETTDLVEFLKSL